MVHFKECVESMELCFNAHSDFEVHQGDTDLILQSILASKIGKSISLIFKRLYNEPKCSAKM